MATSAGLTFANVGLSAQTTYRYRVRAADALGNVGAYSLIVQATTPSSRHWWDVPAGPRQVRPFRPMGTLTPLK